MIGISDGTALRGDMTSATAMIYKWNLVQFSLILFIYMVVV